MVHSIDWTMQLVASLNGEPLQNAYSLLLTHERCNTYRSPKHPSRSAWLPVKLRFVFFGTVAAS